MLAIILSILKVIGIAILVLIALVLLLLLLVFFAPIRYQATGEYEGQLKAKAKITWFLPFSKIVAWYTDGLHYEAKVFGIVLLSSDKERKSRKKLSNKKKKIDRSDNDQIKQEKSDNNNQNEKAADKAETEKTIDSEPEDTGILSEIRQNETKQKEEIQNEISKNELEQNNQKTEIDRNSKNIDQKDSDAQKKSPTDTHSMEDPSGYVKESLQKECKLEETIQTSESGDAEEKPESNQKKNQEATQERKRKRKTIGRFGMYLFQKWKSFLKKITQKYRIICIKIRTIWKKVQEKCKNITCTLQKIYDKISQGAQIIQYYIELWENPKTQKTIEVCKARLYKLWKHLKPKVFRINLHIGLEDPAQTGQIMGIWGMFYPFWGENFLITPEFEEEIFEGNFKIKGRMTVFVVVVTALKFYRDKDLKKLIQRLKKGRKINGSK